MGENGRGRGENEGEEGGFVENEVGEERGRR